MAKKANVQVKNLLNSLRTGKNMTQAKLAELVDVSPSTISMWEIKKSTPTSEFFDKLCTVLKLNEADVKKLKNWFRNNGKVRKNITATTPVTGKKQKRGKAGDVSFFDMTEIASAIDSMGGHVSPTTLLALLAEKGIKFPVEK